MQKTKKIFILSAAIALLLSTTQVAQAAICTSHDCISTCIDSGNSQKTCLKQCCDLNQIGALEKVMACHDECKPTCQKDAANSLSEYTGCYAFCVHTCAEEQGIIESEIFEQLYMNNTNLISQQLVSAQSQGILHQEANPLSHHHNKTTQETPLVFVDYSQCNIDCYYLSSFKLIMECQNNCTNYFIKNQTEEAYKQKWFALQQSTFNMNGQQCNEKCLANFDRATCCQPLNKNIIKLLKIVPKVCQEKTLKNDMTCIQNGLYLLDIDNEFKNSDLIFKTCKNIYPLENELLYKCIIKAQVQEFPQAPQYNRSVRLQEVDQNMKEMFMCLQDCNQNTVCEKDCLASVKEEFANEYEESAQLKRKCETLSFTTPEFCYKTYFVEGTSLLMSMIHLEEYQKVQQNDPTFQLDTADWEGFQNCQMVCLTNQSLAQLPEQLECVDKCHQKFIEQYNQALTYLVKDENALPVFTLKKCEVAIPMVLAANKTQERTEHKIRIADPIFLKGSVISNSITLQYYRCIMYAQLESQYLLCELEYQNAVKQNSLTIDQWQEELKNQSVDPNSYSTAHYQPHSNLTKVYSQLKLVDTHSKEIREHMTRAALLQSYDNQDFDHDLEEELKRRKEIEEEEIKKYVQVLRTLAKIEFVVDVRRKWEESLIQNVSHYELEACNATCAAQCFTINGEFSSSIAVTASECVSTLCGCKQPTLNDTVNLDDIIPPINSFPEFLMSAINEKTIEEASTTEEIQSCNIECTAECLSLENLKFGAIEACYQTACSCHMNLFYRPSACNFSCAQKCQYLSSFGEFGRDQCMSHCGCGVEPENDNSTIHSVPLSLIQKFSEDQTQLIYAQQKMSIVKRYLMIVMFIIVMWTSVLAAINYPIKKKLFWNGNGNNESESNTDEKMMEEEELRQSKKVASQRMLSKSYINHEDDSFEIEGSYEKVY